MKKGIKPEQSASFQEDSSKIQPVKAEHRALYDNVAMLGREAERLAFNREDYRYMLRVSAAATEDFLETTSKDPHYARYTTDSITFKSDF